MGRYTNDEIKNTFHPILKKYFGKRGLPNLHWNVFSDKNQGILTLRIDDNFKKYDKEVIKIAKFYDIFIDRLHIVNGYILEHIYNVCPELQNEYIVIFYPNYGNARYKVFDLTYTNKFGIKRNVNCFACYKNFKVINKI